MTLTSAAISIPHAIHPTGNEDVPYLRPLYPCEGADPAAPGPCLKVHEEHTKGFEYPGNIQYPENLHYAEFSEYGGEWQGFFCRECRQALQEMDPSCFVCGHTVRSFESSGLTLQDVLDKRGEARPNAAESRETGIGYHLKFESSGLTLQDVLDKRGEARPAATDPPENSGIGYHLNIPTVLVPRVAEFLAQNGIPFHPVNDMTALAEDLPGNSGLNGSEIENLIQGINLHLDEVQARPRIPENHRDWSLGRKWQFLRLALENFHWQGYRVRETWWQEYCFSWRRVADQYPLVFGGKE